MPTPFFPTNPVPEGRRAVAVDTETFLIQPGLQAPKLVCVSVCEANQAPDLYDHIDGLEVFRRLLSDDNVLLVFANAPFDLAVFIAEDPSLFRLVIRAFLMERIADTFIWQRLFQVKYGWTEFDPVLKVKVTDGYYSLGNLSVRWLGEEMKGKHNEDAWRFRYSELYGIPLDQWPEDAKSYAAGDASSTVRVWQQQTEREGILPDFWRKCRQAFALYLKTCRGLRTDPLLTRELESFLHEHVDSALLVLLDAGIYRIGGTKKAPKLVQTKSEVQRRVEESLNRLGVDVPKTPPSSTFPQGQVKTDDETLELTDDEDLLLLSEVGSDKTLLTNFVPKLLQGNLYPISAKYTVPMDTGRSSSGGDKETKRGFNAQQMPRKGGARECFVPREGYVFVDCDYNIAEVRSLAQVLINMYGYSSMAEVIKEGDAHTAAGEKGWDVHCKMAAAILGIPLAEFAPRFAQGAKECKTARQTAKIVVFGAPGGLGGKTFVVYAWTNSGHTIKLTREEADELIALYKRTFPEMEQYFTDIGALCGRGSRTTLVQFGSGRIRGQTSFCAAANGNFQSLTADGALEADWRVAVECYLGIPYVDDAQVIACIEGRMTYQESDLFGSYPVWFIHDEIGLESLFAKAQAAAARLAQVMREAMEIFTPDIPSVAEADIRRRWYKDAEPEFNKAGELVPWTPKNPRKVLAKTMGDDTAPAAHGDGWWTDEELAQVESYYPPPESDPTYWSQMNKSWRWEMLARQRNPDPWC